MHPERAVAGHAVELDLGLGESLLDFLRALEAFRPLQHVVGRLCARRAGALRVGKEVRQAFGAVLRALDARVKADLSHSFGKSFERVYRRWRGIATRKLGRWFPIRADLKSDRTSDQAK